MILQVTKQQYNYCIQEFAGVIFHREYNNEYFIEIVLSKYTNYIKEYLRSSVGEV